MSDEGESEDPWAHYSSGPFCRHRADPSDCDETCAACSHTSDCDETCAACSHTCAQHFAFEPYECTAENCSCAGWVERDDAKEPT